MSEINIGIIIKTNKLAKFDITDKLNTSINIYFALTLEDIHFMIETYIWEKYGVSLHYGEDFEIDNESQEMIESVFETRR